MAAHSSILAWEISWTVEPGGLQFKGLQRVRYNLATKQQQQINRGNDKAAAAAKSHQSCPTVRPHRWQPTRLPCPWDSPGKNTGVGYHFLLQCMKVKSESEVAQSCPTLHDAMDCSLTGSSTHGSSQARVLEWVAIAFSNDKANGEKYE